MSDVIPVRAMAVLGLAPVQWQDHADLGADDRADYLRDLDDDLTATLVHVARTRGYFAARARGADHRRAVAASNLIVERVRKLAGFSYPKDELFF